MRKLTLAACLGACLGALSSCSLLAPAAVVPMPMILQQELGPEHSAGLLVLLPGAGDRADRFRQHGILEMARELAPSFDVIAADAHIGYYTSKSLLERLDADVILPAIDAGYRQIWLLGISIGSFGALHYASQHPQRIDGVLLLGPFLGSGAVAKSVLTAPDLASWDAQAIEPKGDMNRITHAVWSWLQAQVAAADGATILLGYGSGDGPGTISERLQQALQSDHFATRPGGHDWNTWRPLIRELLPQMNAARTSRGSAGGVVR
ncbi:MAG: pimeloyl-ACP methyl ester carboxylesterase [Planctomycetota bacterium]|jgi:pimeloyl-ACP methyl ester carboxylesterase